MPDIDTPDPETPPTPEEIEAWPSGRTPDEQPPTTPNPSTGGDGDDPEDAALETPIEPGDALAQPSGGDVAGWRAGPLRHAASGAAPPPP